MNNLSEKEGQPVSVQNTAPTRRSRREAEKKKAVSRGKGRKIAVNIAKVFTLLLLTAALLLSAVVGLCYVVFKGPSEAARDLLVVSAMETSAMKFVPRVFFTQEEIDRIIENNSVVQTYEVTEPQKVQNGMAAGDSSQESETEPLDMSAIEIVEVTGMTYKGKMMIVNDPSRVYVATPSAFGLASGGLRVEEMCKRDNAIAGVNGGGFMDENGVGNGGMPIGLVISNGVMMNGYPSMVSEVIGFDMDNHLVVGQMTAQEALDRGVRDAVNFGPILVVNGEPAQVSGSGGGLNPRTAIGQRADGAVLILVIDGRQSHSLGASYKDLIEVMLEFGAVNAANLDGGSSSLMVYEDEIITTCASLYGSRKIPTAILVKRVGE